MQSISTLLLLLLPLALALPSPQDASTVEPNACTTTCASDFACVDSYPESCICWNQVIADCAAKCGQAPAPTADDCSVKRAVGCQSNCVGKYACLQVWPQSCYCENAIKTQCAAECGGTPTLATCPPLAAES
ncbi:hypothetical protein BZA05DRAFT_419833 [Tricharina praecox]|uniref:uncharacterized protein n=1 Tax=Tricharina praecox TaxID=43433 RepID=UPI002220FEEE|nr:uncharacterized protein BZA05DRAFT_419833 [Tricharina praecox]KAI5849137.1 hypothetical protein BZA05DRAFT_419833 [Tricharina praecox]